MRDDGRGPRIVNLASPRGWLHTAVTGLEVVKIYIYEGGLITGTRGLRLGEDASHWDTDCRIFPVIIFEMVVGEAGWMEWRIDEHWGRAGFVTAAPVLWIEAVPLPRM